MNKVYQCSECGRSMPSRNTFNWSGVDICRSCIQDRADKTRAMKWLAEKGMVAVPVELTAKHRAAYEGVSSLAYPAQNEHYRADHYWTQLIKAAQEGANE